MFTHVSRSINYLLYFLPQWEERVVESGDEKEEKDRPLLLDGPVVKAVVAHTVTLKEYLFCYKNVWEPQKKIVKKLVGALW